MTRRNLGAVLAACAALAVAAPAFAQERTPERERYDRRAKPVRPPRPRPPPRAVPEFEVAAAGTLAALLAVGGVLVARRRRER